MTELFGENGLSLKNFYMKYWRQAPLHIKGGAETFLNFSFNEERFIKTADALERIKPSNKIKGGQGVVFLQNMDLVDDELQAFSKRISKQTGWPSPWFDSVLTKVGSAGGIGSHFDDSDNFVFQVSGTKRWQLSSPASIPQEIIRRRMLRDPGVGTFKLCSNPMNFLLQPGDVLYVPLFWIHHGISSGNSLSVSLVCNTQSALFSLIPIIRDSLSMYDEWWQANPQIASSHIKDTLDSGSLDINQSWYKSKEDSFERLWAIFTDPDFKQDVKKAWISSI